MKGWQKCYSLCHLLRLGKFSLETSFDCKFVYFFSTKKETAIKYIEYCLHFCLNYPFKNFLF